VVRLGDVPANTTIDDVMQNPETGELEGVVEFDYRNEKEPIRQLFQTVKGKAKALRQQMALGLLQKYAKDLGPNSQEYRKLKEHIIQEYLNTELSNTNLQIATIDKFRKESPEQYWAAGDYIPKLKNNNKALVNALFVIQRDTPPVDVKSAYDSAVRQIQKSITDTNQQGLALDMLDLMYATYMQDNNMFDVDQLIPR
jgi:hypothetical protein